ncbi:hypothetical protein DAPPUDRAFT_261360 [Daphnia pulex]|uniref:Uncharacterized protein n=1 Tax=Daphnia pulex TaxID=6669 RepID=E9HKW5_DAPPU|nr:hypothetical protein DAPPUDRAFT_261360 [Daphnia pulex]|eukprot:EFX67626.1 hypothetical protein DAPPUDRAFT_261360 [Daphnia pulex]
MQIPLPVPFPLARGSLARERSPLLELLGGLLVKPPSEPVMQIPLPVPFPLARGSLARERSPLLELLGGILVKSPSEKMKD